jgi:DNA-binding response OmpR family regulator
VKPLLKRLLFVDDEPNIRATLPIILRRYGFTVTVAATVKQALEKVKTGHFDLLLCDLNIEHESDGFLVIRAMQQVNPDCVVIVLTGYPTLNTAVEGLHLRIDDYISKPANADSLVATLADKLAARQPKARILSVSYDEPLLRTWTLLARTQGYEVVPVLQLRAALDLCKRESFDVILLGSSLPLTHKQNLTSTFRECCRVPVISVCADPASPERDGADHHVGLDPEMMLDCIAEVIKQKAAAKNGAA